MMAITTSSSTSVKPRRFELKAESVIENTFCPCGSFYEKMKESIRKRVARKRAPGLT
jgi:hypothetical protein